MNHYMGIDIGTSACKAVIFNEDGRQISMAQREYNLISTNPGWAELDTDEVCSKCFEVIKESASAVEAGSVKGMGFSCQGEAFTLIDKDGKALCNALVSSDIRANVMINPFLEKFGAEKLYFITGHTPHPMFSLFKILWLKEHMPEKWAKCDRILCFEDLLQYRLGIKNPSIGWPLAGRTMLFNVISHEWNNEILFHAGVRPEQLSKPLQSGSVAGNVNKEIAKELNLGENTFIVTGGHDQACAGLGSGAIEPGIAVYTSGTVECITPAFNKPVFTSNLRKNNLCTYDHAAPDMYATVAFSLTGGNLLKWFKDEFGASEIALAEKSNCSPYELLLEKLPEGPTRLLVLPYFTPSGTPYFDVNVKAAILGLDLSVRRVEILKALLEGVAFEIKLNMEILRQSGYIVNELRIIGGGSRSLKHIQLKSDVIGMPISLLNVSEAGCMGVAMLVKAAFTSEPVSNIARNWVRPVAQVKPNNVDFYKQKFGDYKKLYGVLKNF